MKTILSYTGSLSTLVVESELQETFLARLLDNLVASTKKELPYLELGENYVQIEVVISEGPPPDPEKEILEVREDE